MAAATREFWTDKFDDADEVNTKIWKESPAVQELLMATGNREFLTQQSAVALPYLPWPPDLIGTESQGEEGCFVVGSTYAGFISDESSREYCARRKSMPLKVYRNAAADPECYSTFLTEFVSRVIVDDAAFYGKLEDLLSRLGMTASQVSFTELCPGSFISIDPLTGKHSSKQPKGRSAQEFTRYVDCESIRTWRRLRFKRSRAKRIIALGHLAEHGLLRFFAQEGASIDHGGILWEGSPSVQNCRWVERHAKFKMPHWLSGSSNFWRVTFADRQYILTPIYHPSTANQWDKDYQRTLNALRRAFKL